jgi:hypothetical protein
MSIIKRRDLLLGLATPLVLVAASSQAQPAQPPKDTHTLSSYTPAQTRVVLLPVVNLSGEKDKKQRLEQTKKASEELFKQFNDRKFNVLTDAEVRDALDDLEIDMEDEENHNRATLYKIGEKLNTDLVAFVVIQGIEQRRTNQVGILRNSGDGELVASCIIKIWLLDVPKKQRILSAYRQEAQSKNNVFPSFDSGARLIRKSVEGAVRDSLKDFFKSQQINQ